MHLQLDFLLRLLYFMALKDKLIKGIIIVACTKAIKEKSVLIDRQM